MPELSGSENDAHILGIINGKVDGQCSRVLDLVTHVTTITQSLVQTNTAKNKYITIGNIGFEVVERTVHDGKFIKDAVYTDFDKVHIE